MSHKSPLFVSALELLSHSIELYTDGENNKYKFIILHLANSIELILKDRLLLEGISIYSENGHGTINIWRAFKQLEEINIKVIERPIIELLVDDRNTLQHRFGFPNTTTVYYYLENVIAFFERFLEKEYDVDLTTELKYNLNKEAFELLELIIDKDEVAYLSRLFQISPEVAAERLHNSIKTEILAIIKPHIIYSLPQILYILRTLQYLKQDNQISEESYNSFSMDEPPIDPKEFKNSINLLKQLRQLRQMDFIPKIEGVTVVPSENISK